MDAVWLHRLRRNAGMLFCSARWPWEDGAVRMVFHCVHFIERGVLYSEQYRVFSPYLPCDEEQQRARTDGFLPLHLCIFHKPSDTDHYRGVCGPVRRRCSSMEDGGNYLCSGRPCGKYNFRPFRQGTPRRGTKRWGNSRGGRKLWACPGVPAACEK